MYNINVCSIHICICMCNYSILYYIQFTKEAIYPTSHADFGAATHPGVGGGTHRRRATFDRC